MEDRGIVRQTGAADGGDAVPRGRRDALEHAPERLRGADSRRPAVIVLAIAAVIGVLAWKPWGDERVAVVPSASPSPVVARRTASPPAPSPAAGRTPAPPAPSAPPASTPNPVAGGTGRYVSLTDNEWTVVALLAVGAPASTEEPATPHVPAPSFSPGGPFLVMQQGLTVVAAPVERAGHPEDACLPPATPRDRTAVRLPAGRVVYLGITFPGMDPRAVVTAVRLGRTGDGLRPALRPNVRIAGQPANRSYRIPASGPGGAILFAQRPAAILVSGAYRFEVSAPGTRGPRYLYACIGG
jgi:hypothetical protein